MRVLFFSLFFLIFSRFVMAQVCELKCRNEHSQRLSKLKTDFYPTNFYNKNQEKSLAQQNDVDLNTCLNQCDTCAEGTTRYYTSYYISIGIGTNYLKCRCPDEESAINPGEPLSACEREINLDEDINPLVGEKADQDCLKMQNQIKNCTPLKVNVNMSDFTNSGSSMESCRSLRLRAQNISASTTSKIARCNEEINRVISESEESSRCPDEAVRKTLHKTLHKILEDLKQSGNDYYAMSDSFKERADQCIAAFKKDPNPSLDPYPDSNPGQPPDTQTSQDSRKTTNWSGLAQTAAQAFENLNGFGLEASIDGGELDSSSNAPNAASSPSFKQFNNNNGGLRESPYSRFNDEDGGGGFNGDGDPEDSIRNPQRTHGNKNPRNQASQAGLTAQRGHGGPSGANGGGFGSRNNGGGVSPSTNANQRGQARRRFASTKKRNLVLGYKRVKRGGSALTYHPTDLKKYGRDHVLTMARKAKKTFGEETPLLFENGEFIRDYLEMKNSLAWKKHNLRQRNRLSGIFKTKEEREKKAFHPCALVGECYTESRYNIFMLHHFAVIKFISDREE